MNNKIILATINSKKKLYSVTADEFSAVAPNLQLGLLTEYVKSKGIDVLMVESDVDMVSMVDLIDLVAKEQPLLFGVICSGANPSSSTMTMAGIVDFFEEFDQSQVTAKTFIWGPHPTVLPERTLTETGTDFIVRGEGYQTIVDLVHCLENKQDPAKVDGLSFICQSSGDDQDFVHTPDVPLVEDLDSLPPINWDLMPPSKYRSHNWHAFGDMNNRSPYAIIWTSFGCPFKCNFCCINNLFGKRTQRFRSIDSVMAEIDILVLKHGVKHLKILDELFVVNPRRIEEFCDKLESRHYDLNMWAYSRVDTISRHLLQRLKKVGMNWISYGFESATTEILQAADKGCRNLHVDEVIKMTKEEGVSICADVMFGLWDEDYDSMQRTFDFLVQYNFEWANMYPVFPYPGTKLYDQIEEPKDWRGYSLYGYECRPQATKHLSAAQVLRFRDEAFVRYHSRPQYLDMIERKFDKATRAHIEGMVKVPLKRRLLQGD
ncbi:B12-binding domain-containing radical SAM protein [Candidatus Omnitrophota bacterium]